MPGRNRRAIAPACGRWASRSALINFRKKVDQMKTTFAFFAVLISLGLASSTTPARADADDAAWIKKCVSDNKREGATAEVVAAYCSCMNGKMSSDETLSVTAWEKSHPDEMAACDKESGWK
jgi:hypothetical protein